jgi:hypothetical protein
MGNVANFSAFTVSKVDGITFNVAVMGWPAALWALTLICQSPVNMSVVGSGTGTARTTFKLANSASTPRKELEPRMETHECVCESWEIMGAVLRGSLASASPGAGILVDSVIDAGYEFA